MHQEADRRRLFGRRALLVGAGQAVAGGALLARLWQLQVAQNAPYRLLAEDNRLSERLLPPRRGRILDRAGRPLADNVPTYRVLVVREQAGDLRAVLDRLARLVRLEPERIEATLAQAGTVRRFAPLLVREDLDWDEVTRLAVHTPELPGVRLDSGLLRRYPEGPVSAHIVGYVGAVSPSEQAGDPDPLLDLPESRIGKIGIERSYDGTLRGRAGVSRLEVNALGREIREIERREGAPGADVSLHLDLGLQRFCVERLAGEQAAAAVVLDIATGGVRAMASVPSFDPALFGGELSPAAWQGLRDDPRKPMLNKCVRGQYPPGSTFKLITALAGLEAGVIGPDSRLSCTGVVSLGRAKFHCWKERGHGRLDLTQAVAQSCDCFFYEVARRVGIDALAAMANRFGLGVPAGIDLPGEQPGLIPTSAWKKKTLGVSWQKGETLVCGIGQGFVAATPLQLAVMTARLATGRAVRPSLAGDAPAAFAPLDCGEASRLAVLKGMREVVEGPRGTARLTAALGLPGVEMAGKTGSSQVRRMSKAERAAGAERRKRMELPWAERDHALFVCYAPYDRPAYAVAAIVEHGEHGASAAAPLARDLMRKALELDRAAPGPATVSLAPAGGGRA